MSLAQLYGWRAMQLSVYGVPRAPERNSRRLSREFLLDRGIDLLIPAVVLLHLFASPYTKVEESFNVQATHDILQYGMPYRNATTILAEDFDHTHFPGSVPRTFVGAIVLAAVSSPFKYFVSSPTTFQLLVRMVLGLANAAALWSMKQAVNIAYGRAAGRWYVLLQASQFHIMYYASRPLPNIFAFVLTTIAQRNLILLKSVTSRTRNSARRRSLAIYLLVFAGVVFRSEISIWLAMEVLYMFFQQKVSLIDEMIPKGLLSAASALSVTVFIDSFFWQTPLLWPEWRAFYYNAIQGKSSQWGTSPAYFYFLNALPRLLLNPLVYLICIPMALQSKALRKTSQDILGPHVLFISIYSLLPHKEWRFVIYSVPAFTAVASSFAGWAWIRQAKSTLYRFLSMLLLLSTIATFLISLALLYISSLNYPGGEALRRLHELIPQSTGDKITIHLGNLACQTGVTRFQQIHSNWTYDKTEKGSYLLDPLFWQDIDYVLAESPERVIGSWEPIEIVQGYGGLTLRPSVDDDVLPLPSSYSKLLQPVKKVYVAVALFVRQKFTKEYWPAVQMEPRIYILQRAPGLLDQT